MADTKVKLDVGEDFDQWWQDVAAELREKRLFYYCGEEYDDDCLDDFQEEHKKEAHIEASMIIGNRVAPSLLSRIPPDDRFRPRILRDRLSDFSKPFRILDLPSELRFRIYEMNFQSCLCGKAEFKPLDGFNDDPTIIWRKAPSSTRVCRVLRAESLGLFASSTRMTLILPNCHDTDGAFEISQQVQAWSEASDKQFIRHLRDVYFFIYQDSGWRLTFSEQKGLQIAFNYYEENEEHEWQAENPDCPKGMDRDRVEEYIKTVEADRRALGLKGESIILAMLKDPMIWICPQA